MVCNRFYHLLVLTYTSKFQKPFARSRIYLYRSIQQPNIRFSRTSIFNCSRLQHLDLSFNSLFGFLPANIHKLLPKHAYLNLASNSLSGSIPSTICQLHGLRLTIILMKDTQQSLEISQNFKFCILLTIPLLQAGCIHSLEI
jgi:hypothetical protein